MLSDPQSQYKAIQRRAERLDGGFSPHGCGEWRDNLADVAPGGGDADAGPGCEAGVGVAVAKVGKGE